MTCAFDLPFTCDFVENAAAPSASSVGGSVAAQEEEGGRQREENAWCSGVWPFVCRFAGDGHTIDATSPAAHRARCGAASLLPSRRVPAHAESCGWLTQRTRAKDWHRNALHDPGPLQQVRASPYLPFLLFMSCNIRRSDMLHSFLIPFGNSKFGASAVAAFVARAQAQFPDFMEEVRGIAEGADVSFAHTILMNFRDEISFIATNSSRHGQHADSPSSCSDFMLMQGKLTCTRHTGPSIHSSNCSSSGRISSSSSSSRKGSGGSRSSAAGATAIIGHNEDGADPHNNHTFILRASLSSGPNFTAYMYAGS